MIVALLFIISTLNNADRAILSITGTEIRADFGFSAVTLGYMFSVFAWAYMLAQIPGGRFVDRFGVKRIYAISIFVWSFFTLLQGFAPILGVGAAVAALFALRIGVGLAEGPAYPANGRVVATWFPTSERATASAIFNSAQYAAAVVFTPLMAWLTHDHGWESAYFFMGGLGMVLTFGWLWLYDQPRKHRMANDAEIEYIAAGGALVDIEETSTVSGDSKPKINSWNVVKQLLSSRMMIGLYVGQFFITTIVYFFLTWFPIYLIQELDMNLLDAGLTAAIPAIFGFTGGILGGLLSDRLLKRGASLTVARKVPIVIGLSLSTCIVLCNFTSTETVVILLMVLAFFGKGLGSLGWTLVSDTSPKEAAGLSGGLFNTFANAAGITTPIIIGYIVDATGSFDGALLFVGISAALAVASFLLIMGKVSRVELKLDAPA
ncbi:MFS transporter [Rhodococcoides kyotonense]|nr:MFS transporter [Rhodococcus kyotonensis]